MTLRAGSYNSNKPDWRGVIRDDGWAVYVCYHITHESPAKARDCAQEALAYIKDNNELPKGWSLSDAARRAQKEQEKNN